MGRHGYGPRTDEVPVRRGVPVALMTVGAVLAAVAGTAVLWWPEEATPARSTPWWDEPTSVRASPERPRVDPDRARTLQGLAVLRRWDTRRAEAYAAGDPALLRPLYARGSEAGRRDRVLLTRYVDRGLVVRGLTPQIRRAEVTRTAPGRLRVTVEERYPQVRVRRHTREVDVADAGQGRGYQQRTVVLRRAAEGWRVSAVEPA